jgi:hypothetical protein
MHKTVFSWEVVLELIIIGQSRRAAGRRFGRGTAAGGIGKLAGAVRDSRYVSAVPLSISVAQEQRRID